MIVLPKKTDFIFDNLLKNGFECFAVGGCVRDLVRGCNPTDFDLQQTQSLHKSKLVFQNTRLLI